MFQIYIHTIATPVLVHHLSGKVLLQFPFLQTSKQKLYGDVLNATTKMICILYIDRIVSVVL
jgi:hypothetical protein